jgi:hypothetical protein
MTTNASIQHVTFVTAYYTIYDQPFLHRTKNWRFDRFREICQTGIPICIFCESESLNEVREIAYSCPNLYIMHFPEGLAGTEIWKMTKSGASQHQMPASSREGKDTVDYFILMNAKAEFVARAIAVNPFHTGKFAWMDFNLSHVFKDTVASTNHMRTITASQYKEPFLTFPGCWPKLDRDDHGVVIDYVHWRFCGGFFVGDTDSLKRFYELYMTHYPIFLETYQAVTWEVNFWAWLEVQVPEWRPTWFAADHNDSIIRIPTDFLARSLNAHEGEDQGTQRDVIQGLLELPGYYPGSVAYVRDRRSGRHYANIRYINYEILENGVYYFPGGDATIRTQNVFAELAKETKEDGREGEGGAFGAPWTIQQIHCMTEQDLGLPANPTSNCVGLEDIRLYDTPDGSLRFSANSVNYSDNGRNKMIDGLYDTQTHSFRDARIIEAPTDTWIEKNWIPLGDPKDTYIYSWNPYKIGTINQQTNRLEIVKEVNIPNPLFDKFRGSSIFVADPRTPNSLIGVVHLSEEGSPRRYYHALVRLDRESLCPTGVSELFYFEKRGIEFCIGFAVVEGEGASNDDGDEYHFWISRMDRDPVLWRVKQGLIGWSGNKI